MTEKLKLVRKKGINGCPLEYYRDTASENNADIWITREQAGKILGYAKPCSAVAVIHRRHSDRLGKFSKRIRVTLGDGGEREFIAYSFKGLLEICRWSRQPNADTIIHSLWDFFAEIESNSKKQRR